MIAFRTSRLACVAAAALLTACAPAIPLLPVSQQPQAELTPEQSQRLTEALLRRLEQSPAPTQATGAQTTRTMVAAAIVSSPVK